MDEWSAGNAIAAMLIASENIAEVMIFAINMRNQMIAGEALQILMLCVMQSIKYTGYKKLIEITKQGITYITTSSGIRTLLVANELIFAAAENRTQNSSTIRKGIPTHYTFFPCYIAETNVT